MCTVHVSFLVYLVLYKLQYEIDVDSFIIDIMRKKEEHVNFAGTCHVYWDEDQCF